MIVTMPMIRKTRKLQQWLLNEYKKKSISSLKNEMSITTSRIENGLQKKDSSDVEYRGRTYARRQ